MQRVTLRAADRYGGGRRHQQALAHPAATRRRPLPATVWPSPCQSPWLPLLASQLYAACAAGVVSRSPRRQAVVGTCSTSCARALRVQRSNERCTRKGVRVLRVWIVCKVCKCGGVGVSREGRLHSPRGFTGAMARAVQLQKGECDGQVELVLFFVPVFNKRVSEKR